MKKLKLLIMGFLLSLFILGCSNDIDIVKNGTMNFNKTITVGEAFDRWNNCQKREWESFETDNGVRVVQFTCGNKDYISKYLYKIKSFLPKKEQNANYLNLRDMQQIFQWTINRDNTFQIDNIQLEFIWNNGKKSNVPMEIIEELKKVYKNEAFNENEELKNIGKFSAGLLVNVLQEAYKKAK